VEPTNDSITTDFIVFVETLESLPLLTGILCQGAEPSIEGGSRLMHIYDHVHRINGTMQDWPSPPTKTGPKTKVEDSTDDDNAVRRKPREKSARPGGEVEVLYHLRKSIKVFRSIIDNTSAGSTGATASFSSKAD
jgi:hypothetical protein